MAELNLFRYISGSSPLHRMDPRFKLAAVGLLSVACGWAGHPRKLVWLTALLLLAICCSGLPVRAFLLELRRFSVFLVAAVLIQAWGQSGSSPAGVSWPGITREGFGAGLMYAWRLVDVLLIGVLFTGTTRGCEIRAAVFWFLAWVPGIPAGRIATMFSLILTLVPLIFTQGLLIREAQVTRGVEAVANPLRRLRYFAWPVIRQTLHRADALVLAMEARCYSERQTLPLFCATALDWGLFGLTLGVLVTMSLP